MDDGTVVKTKVLGTPAAEPYASNAEDNTPGTGGTGVTALADDKLTITVGKFGWERSTANNLDMGHRWGRLDKDDPDTDEAETNNDTMKYEISLSALLAKAGSSGDFSDKQANFVAEARKMIETERTKLAVLIQTEQLEDTAQPAIWRRIQEILLANIFDPDKTDGSSGRDGDTGAFLSRLPDDINGTYKKDTALETIDEILVALSSASDLEAAFDEDETALFVPDDEDDKTFLHGRTAGQIWGQTGLEVRARAGKTDFTRFGVWRVRRARTASYHDWVNGEMDTFAYSPLDVSKITRNSPNYPVGGSAVYEGSTVAWVGTNGYEGDAAMHVTWNQLRNSGDTADLPVGGTITAVFSNLAAASTGDTLMHNSQPVRELVFARLPFTAADDDGELRFNTDAAAVSVRYTNLNAENGAADGANLNGAFVGSSSDGPLGVLGRYMIPGGDGSGFQGGTINGAFGADLP